MTSSEMDMQLESIAELASFEAFANTYLREVDPGVWTRSDARADADAAEPWLAELRLADGSCLILEITYRSTVGKHRFRRLFQRTASGDPLKPLAPFRATLALIREVYRSSDESGKTSSRELELTSRLADSVQCMTMAIRQRNGDPLLHENTFLASEQSLLLGHWMHPTPKSRQGMAWWQQEDYAPELKGGFRLCFFAVRSELVSHDSTAASTAIEISAAAFGTDGIAEIAADEIVIPVHPLQAQWLLAQPHVLEAADLGWIRYLGARGRVFYPTSSVRTVFHPASDWMFKFSIPVKITNSLRRNRSHELNVGVVMTRLMRKLDFFSVYPYFNVVDDPAYLTVKLPGHRETGFETIIRSNPFRDTKGDGIVSIAALTQDPVPTVGSCLNRPPALSRLGEIIKDLSDLEGRPNSVVARDWFEQYWQCAIEPLILLFDQHGIALEAHQQNSLLNVSNGYPTHYYFRDNQGFYLSKSRSPDLHSLEGSVSELEDLFFEDGMIFKRFGYYLIFNQLFSIIYRLGADGHLAESEALSLSREWLVALRTQLTGTGEAFVSYMLNKPSISCKANLLTRAQDVDELEAAHEMAVYVDVPNPYYKMPEPTEQTRKGACR